MRAFFAALALCWFVADAVLHAVPYQAGAQPVPERVITVSVCSPPAPKDQSRVVAGLLIPRLVPTTTYTAADRSPAAQARDTGRKKKPPRP